MGDRSDVILERLTKLHPKLIDLTLDRTERLLGILGHPERKLPPTFHIAGTNGKGSVSAYLRAGLEAGGYGVHAYTSPHLVQFHERIRLAGKPHSAPISEAMLSALLDECEIANGGDNITFFEMTTVAAFLAFSRAPADALILEVGMGGRFDTTNVIASPLVSIITPVDLDHQAFLGETIGEIAFEKAGILKRGAVGVIGPQTSEARDVIESVAAKLGVGLVIHGQDFSAHEEQGHLIYQDEEGLLDLPMPRLLGRHQIDNAAIAICAMRQAAATLALSDDAFVRAMREVSWPARMQRLTYGPLVEQAGNQFELWLDGGHNPSAGRALAHLLADLAQRDARPVILIAGMLDTKDASGFFSPFADIVAHVETIAIPDAPASLSAASLADAARRAGLAAAEAPDLSTALARAMLHAGMGGGRIVICGSLYLAGHVLAHNG